MELYQDYQFSLDGVGFGMGLPVHVDADGFTPSDAALETSVTPHPTSNGVIVGRDRRRSATWGFDMFVNGTDVYDALSNAADLRRAWWNEDIEDTPGAVSELRYRLAGRTRLVYGRGRRWTVSPSNRMINGFLPITADFEVVYPATYDEAQQSVSLTANAANQAIAGIEAPLESPLIGVGNDGEPVSTSITIGGDAEAWVMIDFKGGIDPWVEIGPLRYQLSGTVGTNETVTADSRPWNRGITSDQGGAFAATRTSRLASVKLKPGTYAVQYGNLDFGSAASVTIRWHNAHKSL